MTPELSPPIAAAIDIAPGTRLAVRVRLERGAAHGALPRFRGASCVHRWFRSLGDLDREVFIACLLDAKQRLTGHHIVSVGVLDASPVHPREVFKAAIVGNAASILCVHNHPSGDARPSREDRDVTDRLKRAGALLGIPLLDHVVIGDGEWVSLRELGGW